MCYGVSIPSDDVAGIILPLYVSDGSNDCVLLYIFRGPFSRGIRFLLCVFGFEIVLLPGVRSSVVTSGYRVHAVN